MRASLLLLALFVVGCSTAPFDGDPPEALDIAAEDVADARANWAASGAERYTMVQTRICFCSEDWRGPFDVRVEGGAVVNVEFDGDDVPTERALSIDALLDLLDDALDRNAAIVRAAFDPDLGIPVSVQIDYDVRIADEEVDYTVERYRAQ
ncbi:MAG: DUF6174 domain-containing protein [Bacteroidota bacterium]